MVTSTRIFSFGLGNSPSRSLVKGLARTTNGRFVFIPPETSVVVHVGEQLQKALQPCITNVQIKWNLGETPTTAVLTKISPVYFNDRLIVYALFEDKSTLFDQNSTVELKTDHHQLGQAIINRLPNVNNNEMIARLAAKALILKLQYSKLPSSTNKNVIGSMQSRFQIHDEITTSNDKDQVNKEMIKKRIIELSLKYNILSPYTAFIAVQKRINPNNDDMVLLEIPIQISADDQHLQIHSPPMPVDIGDSESDSDDDCFAIAKCAPLVPAGSIRKGRVAVAISDEDDDDDLFGIKMPIGALLLPCSIKESSVAADDEEEGEDTALFCSYNKKKSEEDAWPTNNQDIVRYLINKQKFDSSWDLDSKIIEQLTGKPLTDFEQTINDQLFVTAIVIAVLEKRFTSFSSMWYGIVQKARKHLINFLDNDMNKLDSLLENIGKQF